MRALSLATALAVLAAACSGDPATTASTSIEPVLTTTSTSTIPPTSATSTTVEPATTTALTTTTTSPPAPAVLPPPPTPPAPAPPVTAPPTTPAPPPSTTAPPPAVAPPISSCPLFPATSYWYADVSKLPVHPSSAAFIASIGATAGLKADFGSGLWEGAPIGIPFTTVGAGQPKVALSFEYDDESDPGPYPVPANPPIEGGPASTGDRHVLVVDTSVCRLYELFAAYPNGDGSWRAGSGAVYDLSSNAMRPAGWTSADAAGLPILPGLVRFDEVAAGSINHAIRITVPRTRRAYVWPARHFASSRTDTNLPPMGQWFRLRADFDVSGFPRDAQVILNALKKHGAIVADNGSAWYMSGAPDERWNNDVLQTLRRVPGSAFEALDTSSLIVDTNSGQRR